MGLSDRIKKIADEKGLSFAEIERKTGISNGQIRKWNNRSPQIENVQKVADFLNVSVDYLLGKTENRAVAGKPPHVDIADDEVVMSFEGKRIPPEDLKLIRRLLRGGKEDDR
ncbi:helix-turn-helix transcriptional regulator [Lactobacillus rhamnosus]|uniref:Helix-turn-helix transcriptional regulator n=1 Tax=Lacticaseibacillus rhamnosus TaxID=47715 RepID=A0A7Y7QGX3_LACRH|nr:helix-turn-helix transcriptional regulator [Lacticaseibacillus rhamnosus]NVO88909.1 helix-turn-helix transcriptional regulator [Lacticaseibacillus rhamnosus]